MKIYTFFKCEQPNSTLNKFLLVTKLILFFLASTILKVNASSYERKINLNRANEPLGEIIKKQPTAIAKARDIFAEIDLRGKVVDGKGESMPGVSVKIKNKTKGVVTDVNGNFQMKAETGDVLVFSFVGFKTAEYVVVSGKNDIRIAMVEDQANLDEVVVVAYGTQKKATVTGAIASIQTKEIKQSPAANLAVTLAGRLPGLTAIQRSGEPGADVTNLYIRGQGTTNAQSPIILVDGVERDLTYIDPNEIESVTILKDASSTAIFGVRGANGVILVATKRGTSEVPEINFTSESSAQSFTRLITPVNSYEFATTRNLAQANDGLSQTYSASDIEHYRTQDDPLRYPDTDWRDILTKKYSLQQRYNLNVSGASKAVKYFVNVGQLSQGSQFKNEDNLPYDPSYNLKRYNFRSNIDIQLNKTLKAYLNIAGTLEKQNGPYYTPGSSQSSFFVIAYMAAQGATTPGPLTPDGKVLTNTILAGAPPYGLLNRFGYQRLNRTNITASYGMDQSLDFLTKGLSVKAQASFDTRSGNLLYASKGFERYIMVIDPVTQDVSYKLANSIQESPLSLSGVNSYSTLANLQGFLNYNRTFNKHAVTGLILFQQQSNIIDVQLPFNLLGVASRLTYGFDNKYFAEFNAGYNGSEQFAKGNRYGFFPAVSGAWLVSNEKFLKNNKVITNLKVRGSYGEVGNDRLSGARFQYLDNISIGSGGYSSSLGNGQRINIATLGNPNLQWEVAKKANVGLELGIFNSFNLVVDVFKERRDNILRNQGTVPVLNGLSLGVLPKLNFGVVENKGYEIELNFKKAYSKNLSLLAKLNFNHARNKQLFADEAILPADYAYRYRETGYQIGTPFGYIVDRYFTDLTDIANSPKQSVGGHESRPGDFKYKDLNNDGLVNARDYAPIGNSNIPENQFGGAFNLTYKNFDLSALMQGVSNVFQYFNQPYGTWEGFNYVKRHTESWTAERAASGEKINYPRITTQGSPNNIPNTFFIVDASYIRLKNVEIGYSLPTNLSRKIGSKGIRIYANGLNLFTWDKLPTKDFDPEVGSSRDNLAYPMLRMYNFGVNVKF
ncbi:MAG: TonB-dependent receptor [Flavobacterium sp.]|nr:TonB-dependent receptor [Pedobacter sp.]